MTTNQHLLIFLSGKVYSQIGENYDTCVSEQLDDIEEDLLFGKEDLDSLSDSQTVDDYVDITDQQDVYHVEASSTDNNFPSPNFYV